jgi:3-phenylpropionate/trans-cinnamate dioxygenase ferredoxin subunit
MAATRHYICRVDELEPGGRKLIQVGKKSIGVFNVDGAYYALLNLCPHQFAPLCEGKVCGYSPPSNVGEFEYEREGEIIRCPWHAWEFDIKTGRSIFNPHKVRTASYPTGSQKPADDEDPSVETFPVHLDKAMVYVEL